MRKLCLIAALICWLAGTHRSAAQEIDRLLAAVNGKVITEGDLTMARSLYALSQLGKAATSQRREEEIHSLIDRELIRQEMENFPIGQADENSIQTYVQTRMDALKSAYAEIGGLPGLLRDLGVQENELVSYLRLRALMERFMNLRFRPFVNAADPDELEQKVNAAMDQWIEDIRNHSRIEIFSDAGGPTDKERK